MRVPIGEIQINEERRGVDAAHVRELADSIRELGLLNPVTVDRENNLIAGLHRLEAVRILGWDEVECTVSSLEGLQAELAEIDENFVRSGLSAIEYGEMLLRRKEIYETLHPETRAGVAQAAAMNRAVGNNVADKMSATSKSFVEDTAGKLNVAPRTVRREIQTAKNLTQEAKEIMKSADAPISKKAAMKLSRLEPVQQKEAAELLAAQKIRTVDEYVAGVGSMAVEEEPLPGRNMEDTGRSPESQNMGGERQEGDSIVDAGLAEDDMDETRRQQQDVFPHAGTSTDTGGASLKEIIAQLKDPDKDCSGTPESFLAEYDAFVRKFHREIGWYNNSYYDTVYPFLNDEQLDTLRKMIDAICSAAEALFERVTQMRKS